MDKALKPIRLDLDPSTPNASKQWKHWKKTFENFMTELVEAVPEGGRQPNKLRALQNNVAPSVYEYIDDLTTYEACIEKLEALYCKTRNEIFARHQLATRRQESGESIDEFLNALKKLSKDCNFQAVTADVYQQELVRDSFISGLSSAYIRQRLLENDKLTQDEAYKQAISLDQAQKNSSAYNAPLAPTGTPNLAAVTTTQFNTPSITNHTPPPQTHLEEPGIQNHDPTLAATARSPNSFNQFTGKTCGFCGEPFHDRQFCTAKNKACDFCGIVGHIEKMCLKKKQQSRRKKGRGTTATVFKPCLFAIPNNLTKAAVEIVVQNRKFSALIDSCSSDSFISGDAVSKLNVKIQTSTQDIDLASTDKTVSTTGTITVDINLHGYKYKSVRLGVMPKLCSDIILGQDFQKRHKKVIIDYGGSLPDLYVGSKKHESPSTVSDSVSVPSCNLAASSLGPVSLFENLRPDCRPIAVKSRRYNHIDKKFIDQEIHQMLKDGIIQHSTSPWRAQIVVVRDDENPHRRKRLCVDFSQTINQYTELDAYPLPRIDDMVNELAEHKVFSTFDLKSAYHQIEIRPEDRIYTSFEANGGLYEFTRIPPGVTNGVPKFQRVVDQVVAKESLKGTFPYMDNVTVGGMNQEDHDMKVEQLRKALKKYGLTLNEPKTVLSVSNINILGYNVSHQLIKPDPERLQALIDLPPPSNPKSLQRAVGLFAYYSKWIHRFSDKILPLSDSKVFPIEGEALAAFENLKIELGDVALQNIDETKPFVLECDASEVAISATLNQDGRPVAFMSKKFEPHELHYPPVEKEATAIIESVRKWEHLLQGKHFTIITDQRSVAFMMDNRKRTKIKNNKILNWRLELASLSYSI